MLKEISPEYSLEGLMLKLKLQYFGHLMQRLDSLDTKEFPRVLSNGQLEDSSNVTAPALNSEVCSKTQEVGCFPTMVRKA